MSLHLEAKQGDIADTVLITGDPLRARHFAKHLQHAFCYNQIRGMEGYTGFYKGRKISIQGTGMGIPSTALYLHELICDYQIKRVIRVGTAGALQPSLQLGQIRPLRIPEWCSIIIKSQGSTPLQTWIFCNRPGLAQKHWA